MAKLSGLRIWVLVFGMVSVARAATSAVDPGTTLWYPREAAVWVEALPIGNGRLGGMDYGGAGRERLQLNEDNVWAGGPYDPANPAAFEAYAKARPLILAGKGLEAADLLKVDGLGNPHSQASYQTIGELDLDFGNVTATDYRRELDLTRAVETVSYHAGTVAITRELFSSAADQVLVMRISGDRPGSVGFSATFTTPYREKEISVSSNELVLNGQSGRFGNIPGQVKHETIVRFVTDGGSVSGAGDTMTVSGANSVVLVIAIRTNYVNYHDLTADADALAQGPGGGRREGV